MSKFILPFVYAFELKILSLLSMEKSFDNGFDFGNAFKSLVRAFLNTQGSGKEGNDLAYELNKIRYSINKIDKS